METYEMTLNKMIQRGTRRDQDERKVLARYRKENYSGRIE
jgi:hypothetical protein